MTQQKPFRFTYEEYKTWRSKLEKEEPGYEDWLQASTTKLDKKELMMRAIMATVDGKQQICFSLMLEKNTLTVDELNNLLFINSGMFSFATWTDECVDFVIGLLKRGTEVDIRDEIEEVAKGNKGKYAELPIQIHRQCKNILGNFDRNKIRRLEALQCDATDTMRSSLFRKSRTAFYKSEIAKYKHAIDETSSKYEKRQLKEKIFQMEQDIKGFAQREKDASGIAMNQVKEFYKALDNHDDDNAFYLIDRFNWIDIYKTQKLPEEYYDSMDALFTASERNKRAEIRAKKKAR